MISCFVLHHPLWFGHQTGSNGGHGSGVGLRRVVLFRRGVGSGQGTFDSRADGARPRTTDCGVRSGIHSERGKI